MTRNILIIDDQLDQLDQLNNPFKIALSRENYKVCIKSFPEAKQLKIEKLKIFDLIISDVRDEEGHDNYSVLCFARQSGLRIPVLLRTNYPKYELDHILVKDFIDKNGSGLFYLSKEESLRETMIIIGKAMDNCLTDETMLEKMKSILSNLSNSNIAGIVLKILNLCSCKDENNFHEADKLFINLKKKLNGQITREDKNQSSFEKLFSEAKESFQRLQECPDPFNLTDIELVQNKKHPYLYHLEKLRDSLLELK